MTTSERIRTRVRTAGAGFFANDNIARYIEPGDWEALHAEVEEKVRELLRTLVIDFENDHNTRDTARRMAKMYLDEVFAGRYLREPTITDFPNAKKLDEIYTVGPIAVHSACAHHFVPISGNAWIGVIPTQRVIGLSKFNRLVQWIMSRPQIQEEAAVQLADSFERLMQPLGLAVVLRAQHTCVTSRGVCDHGSLMVTSVMRGAFRSNDAARAEFMGIIRGQGF